MEAMTIPPDKLALLEQEAREEADKTLFDHHAEQYKEDPEYIWAMTADIRDGYAAAALHYKRQAYEREQNGSKVYTRQEVEGLLMAICLLAEKYELSNNLPGMLIAPGDVMHLARKHGLHIPPQDGK